MKQAAIYFIVVILLTSCAPKSVPESHSSVVAATQTIVPQMVLVGLRTETPAPTVPATSILTPTTTSMPANSATPTADTRLTARYWREWSTTPELSARAREIIGDTANNPELDWHTFSKVGDCQMTSGTFLGGFATGKYSIPEGYEATVRWFYASMESESITAANGLGINSVLNPMFGRAAGYTQCGRNETPLDCELRTRRPVIVLVAMGTNWKPKGEISFEKHLHVVVERILETGALPILSTKADNIEGDWKLNQAIAQVAYDFDLPLVNVWRSVQDLPNRGLQSPENIYLTGDGWMRRNYAWLITLNDIRKLLDP